MKNNLHYQLLFCITTSLALFSFIPTTVGQMMETGEVNLVGLCPKNFSDEIEIQIYLCLNNGNTTNNIKNISVKNAFELTNKFLTIDNTVNSFEESFKQKLAVLKELNLLDEGITIEKLLGNSGNKLIQTSGEIPKTLPIGNRKTIFNVGGIVSFGGIGGGIGFGINSHIPVIGYENIGIFWFRGGITLWGFPLIVPQYLMGRIIGVFTMFTGILIRVLYPYTYGPFVFGLGISGPAIWLNPGIF